MDTHALSTIPIMAFSSDDARSPHHHSSWRSFRADASLDDDIANFGGRENLLQRNGTDDPKDGSDSDTTKRCVDDILIFKFRKLGKAIQRIAAHFRSGQQQAVWDSKIRMWRKDPERQSKASNVCFQHSWFHSLSGTPCLFKGVKWYETDVVCKYLFFARPLQN